MTVEIENCRLTLQEELDAAKERTERNRMGQFATPTALVVDILRYAKDEIGLRDDIRFIDPAVGTGSFFSALLANYPKTSIGAAVGYEVDPHYGTPAAELWSKAGLDVRVEDFTRARTPPDRAKFNLLICNPPYVRHHHIVTRDKKHLKARAFESSGIEIGGLAGLYCYFVGLGHAWMATGGLAGWLLPSEFMDVNYGFPLKRYLLDKVKLLHIHRFDPNEVQFDDALVSSAVVWFRNEAPPTDHAVRFTYGGSLERPKLERFVPAETLRRDPKWTRYPMHAVYAKPEALVLGDLFVIKRGLATGDNKYFILSAEEIERRNLPLETFRPILPSPRYLSEDVVAGDAKGNPVVDHGLFLLDCRLAEEQVESQYPALWRYLQSGKERGIADRYICRHRTPWYAQENRPPAPFVCTYLGRSHKRNGRPFRFILNHSEATAANVYLMLYPRGTLARALEDSPGLRTRVWERLNGISPKAMLGEGRVYGGGLHKLEPRELGNVPAALIEEVLPHAGGVRPQRQAEMF